MSFAICFNLDQSKILSSKSILTYIISTPWSANAFTLNNYCTILLFYDWVNPIPHNPGF